MLTLGNVGSPVQVSGAAQSSLASEHSHAMAHAAQSTASNTVWDEFLANTKSCYPSLTLTPHEGSDGHWAIIEGSTTTCSPLRTKLPTHNPRMVVHAPSESLSCIYYKFEVHFVVLFQGLTTDVQFDVLLQSLLPRSSYCLCPDLPEGLRKSVDFECKSARKWGFPLQRTDHVDCQLWFQAQVTPRLQQEPLCEKCKSLSKYLRKMLRKRASLTPTRKRKRALPSSPCPWKYLSPATRSLRLSRTRKVKFSTKKKLDKYCQFDISVGEATHRELVEVLSAIQHKCTGELQALLAEADFAGKGDILRQKWQQDVQEHLSFHKDQRENGK